MAGDDAVDLEIDGRTVRLSSPGKVLFPERGETKRDLVHHYLRVGEPLMRTMGGRPVLHAALPRGRRRAVLLPEARAEEGAGVAADHDRQRRVNGTTSDALLAADLAHVVWAVNMACLGFHVWPYQAADPDHADELRLDLDPQPGTDFTHVREAARELQGLLDENGVTGYPKTTGNRGLHVYVRLEPRWDSYAGALAPRSRSRASSSAAAPTSSPRRGGRRSAAPGSSSTTTRTRPHKTVFGAWAVRARAGGQVSTPLHLGRGRRRSTPTSSRSRPSPTASSRRRPLGSDQRPPPVARALPRHVRRATAPNGLLDAPWPPVYPKMPDEPPRVAPSRAKKEKSP